MIVKDHTSTVYIIQYNNRASDVTVQGEIPSQTETYTVATKIIQQAARIFLFP